MSTDWNDLGQSVPWASSSSDFPATSASASKKRRIQRACDICRRKKIRCDATQKLSKGSRCSNCVTSGSKCTFSNESTKRGPSQIYVDRLEHKLANMERLLRKLALRVDIEAELAQHASEFPPFLSGHSLDSAAERTATSSNSSGSLGVLTARRHNHPVTALDHDEAEYDSTDGDDEDEEPLPQRITKTFEEFNIIETPTCFHGKSSGLGLFRAATILKKEQGIEPAPNRGAGTQDNSEWERRLLAVPPPTSFTFPPDDLIRILFDLFFLHFTPFLPVIHRPTFEAQFSSGRHLRDTSFAKCVLLVCAIGSRYCDDPRVYIEDIGPKSAGWPYFIQVGDPKPPAYTPATLHDIQCHVMLSYFLQTTCAVGSAWSVAGYGIRLAQERGMHRRKSGKGPISLYDEQEKRAFWCLIAIDRYMSSSIGRPLACQDEDFDLDFPIEVDDEYWSVPEEGAPIPTPHQPTGVPSKISAFVAALKLYQIMALAVRTIYAINKSKALLGFAGEKWEQQIVSELDSRMNKWIDAVPAHFKWDPNRQDEVHFTQSVNLYAVYYFLQIFIHRPFFYPDKGSNALSFPSLSIATNAARSCSHLVEALQARGIQGTIPVSDSSINSGVVLLMAVWGARKTGVSVDSQSAMRDVSQCISYLKWCESSWQCARLMGQVLQNLANCGDLDLTSSSSTPSSHKRSYSRLQDYFPTPPEFSDTSSATRDVRASRSPDNPPLPRSHSQPSSAPIQSSNRAVPHITLPPATAPSALPTGELPISPTSQFLQSYVATLPLDGITISSNPLFQPFDTAILNNLNTGGAGDIATSTSFPISTDFTSSGTKTTEWDNLIRFGFHSSSAAASDSLRFAPGSSSSASHLVGDPYLGIPGFGGSIGFAAEAQALVGGGGIGADDVDWGSILNFGSNLDHARISKPSDT